MDQTQTRIRKPPMSGSLIKSNLDKPTVSRQNIAKLVHCCTPTETLVDVIKDIGCVRFTNAREVGGDFSAQSLCSAHQASPRTIREALRARPWTVLETKLVTFRCPGRCKRLPAHSGEPGWEFATGVGVEGGRALAPLRLWCFIRGTYQISQRQNHSRCGLGCP